MSNVVDVLERLGQDARLRHVTSVELADILERAGLEPAVRSAMLGSDRHSLEAVTGATANVCCMVNVPEDHEDPSEGVRVTLADSSRRALESLVGAAPNTCCLVNFPEDDDGKGEHIRPS
jgi:hypothetical protein